MVGDIYSSERWSRLYWLSQQHFQADDWAVLDIFNYAQNKTTPRFMWGLDASNIGKFCKHSRKEAFCQQRALLYFSSESALNSNLNVVCPLSKEWSMQNFVFGLVCTFTVPYYRTFIVRNLPNESCIGKSGTFLLFTKRGQKTDSRVVDKTNSQKCV